jgi:hypothetical protein
MSETTYTLTYDHYVLKGDKVTVFMKFEGEGIGLDEPLFEIEFTLKELGLDKMKYSKGKYGGIGRNRENRD